MNKKKMKWRVPKRPRWTDFQVVPMQPRNETDSSKDGAFGDFNAPLKEQPDWERDEWTSRPICSEE